MLRPTIVRLNEIIPQEKHVMTKASLQPVSEKVPLAQLDMIDLVPEKENILITLEQNFSLFNPNGKIPNYYSDVQTLKLANQAIDEEKLYLNGNIIETHISPEKKLPHVLQHSVNRWNDIAYPSGMLFWGNIFHKPNQSLWITSHPFMPKGKNNILESQWFWCKNKSNDWPDPDTKADWKPVCLRSNKSNGFSKQYPPDDLNAQWVWDNLSWSPEFHFNSIQQRFFICTFHLSKVSIIKKMLTWYLISPASVIDVYLNGNQLNALNLYTPKKLNHTFQINCPSNLLKKNSTNTLAFKLKIYPPKKRAVDNPGFQLKLTIDNNTFHTGKKGWEVSITHYLNWWESERKGQWLTEHSIYKEYTQTNNQSKLLMKHPELNETPVIWINDDQKVEGKQICFFRFPIMIQSKPDHAKLRLYSSGSSTIFLNRKKFECKELNLNSLSVKKYLRPGKQYLYIKVVHPGHGTKAFPLNAGFKTEKNKLTQMDPKCLTYKNRYKKIDRRGNIEDRDQYSYRPTLVFPSQEDNH